MSGGHFNYSQNRISDIIDSINEIIKANKELNYSEDTIQKFKTGIIFLKIAQVYAQRID